MSHSRLLPLAAAAAIATGLTACGAPDPYGPNNYPVSDINPNPGGTALVASGTTTTYVAPGVAAYVAPGTTTTYIAPGGATTTYVAPAGTTAYVVPNTATVVPAQ